MKKGYYPRSFAVALSLFVVLSAAGAEEVANKATLPYAVVDATVNSFASSGDAPPFALDSGLRGVATDPNTVIPGVKASVVFPLHRGSDRVEIVAEAYEVFHDGATFIETRSLFARALYRGFEAAVGKYPIAEGLNPELSSGSLILNGEGPAYPTLYLGTDDFVGVPFTRGILETRFTFSYGTLDDDRYVTDPLIHTKSLLGRLNLPFGLSFTGGLVHAAVWGGTSPVYGELPSGFDSFLKAFFAEAGDEGAPEGERINRQGDHKGMWEYAVEKRFDSFSLLAYYQHYFEDNSGNHYKNEGWRDGLYGLSFQSNGKKLLTGICYEYYNSTNQSGTGGSQITGGMDFYYQNYIYKTGWTYGGAMLGSPFVIVSGDGASINYLHTRARVHFLALSGFIRPNIAYRVQAAFARYFGTYDDYDAGAGAGNDIFENGLPQTSFAVFIRYEGAFAVDGLYGEIGMGADFGDARDDSIGARFTVGYAARTR